MEAFRRIVAAVAAIALAFFIVGAGFLACTLPPVTHGFSSAFSRDDISPFDRNQLVKVADATRDFSFGAHNELALYRAIYDVDAEYARSLADAGGTVPAAFPALGAVRDGADVKQYESAFAHASELYCYSPETISHLDDCYAIASGAYPALGALAIIAVAGLAFTGAASGRARLRRALMGAGTGVIAAFALLGLWAAVDFTGFFAMFHQLLFSQGNWQFPYDSLLICALPEAFWMGMGVVWLAMSLLLALAAVVIGVKLKRR